MSSSELSEWQAYYNIEPFGEIRADLRAGTIASPLVNMWAGKKGRKTKPSDWIMDFGELAKQDPEAMKAMLQAYAAQRNRLLDKQQPKPKRRRHTIAPRSTRQHR